METCRFYGQISQTVQGLHQSAEGRKKEHDAPVSVCVCMCVCVVDLLWLSKQ